MKLEFLLLMVAYLLDNVSSMSTCKTVDQEIIKKKRIEAIRSQILSKLRMAKAPEPEEAGEKEEIPTNLLSLYNNTKDMLKEQQTEVKTVVSSEQEEEEYFAKALNKFNITSKYQTTQPTNTKPRIPHILLVKQTPIIYGSTIVTRYFFKLFNIQKHNT